MLVYLWVPEPRPVPSAPMVAWRALLEPLGHPEYRRFIVFSCVWYATAMFAAPFFQVYALEELRLPVAQVTVLWGVIGVGQAAASKAWGRLADRHGHRPIFLLTGVMKWLTVGTLILAPPGRGGFWALLVVFFIDGLGNAGNMVAQNGYMMKTAPKANRAMFMSAIMGLSGLSGGLGAALGGKVIELLPTTLALPVGACNRFQMLFLLSLVLRLVCLPLAAWLIEPRAHGVRRLVRGMWDGWRGR